MKTFLEFILEHDHPIEWNDGKNTWSLTHLGTAEGYGNGGPAGSKIHYYAGVVKNKEPNGARLIQMGHSGNLRGITKASLMNDPENVASDVNRKFGEIRKFHEDNFRKKRLGE